MDIKEIALRIGEEADEYADAKLQSKGEFHPDWHTVRDEYFAESLIAELAKQNKPVAFTNSCELDYLDFKRADSGLVSAAMWKDYDKDSDIALYTLPPAAYQIEQETAEACAMVYLNTYDLTDIAEDIRNGAWKEFKKS